MAEIRPGDPTPTEDMADRMDDFRIARRLLDEFEWTEAVGVFDVMAVTKWIRGEGETS